MTVALGSDDDAPLASALAARLRELGHEVLLYGALRAAADDDWTSVARGVGSAVAGGTAATGILCCWTGTGVCMAANKLRGVRAALCGDAQTAQGARQWNDANVLCLSLRATSVAVALEILDAWLSAAPTADPKYRAMIDAIE
jgi:ribose 5-phosphate isomerase B